MGIYLKFRDRWSNLRKQPFFGRPKAWGMKGVIICFGTGIKPDTTGWWTISSFGLLGV